MPTGLDLPDLLRLIPPGGALVAPLVTSQGGAVFVLPAETDNVTESHVVWLDDLTEQVLLELLLQGSADTSEWGGWLGAYFNRDSKPERWLETIETTGRSLWKLLLGPVHKRLLKLGLREGDPVILMPQGGIGLLPLHAAWRQVGTGKRYFLDDYTVSYAPSGYALQISRRRIEEPRRQQCSLLAIVNPTADLTFAPLEGEAVAALFAPEARQVLVEKEACSAAVVAQSPKQSYLHFSCHGFYNWEDAMSSGLILAGGTALTLSEIIAELDLSANRLVTLSACETGLTDISQSADEYLGLPAGFLQAGTPAVLSTLWAVDDRSTTLLMEHFYRLHLLDNLRPATALRQAQRWLRDTTNAEKAAYFETFLPESDGGTASNIADALYKSVILAQPSARDFAHPFYWAAFTYTGA
jgi:CHAT domain-containing protein